MASVSLRHINKVYPNGFEAVKDFNLEIEEKEFIVFVGPSGCGKSTTLRMIAGLEDISSGELRIGGKVVNDTEPKDRDIAMIFQNYALYQRMTVYENMAFGLKLRKTPRDEIDRMVREAAKILELEALLDRRPKALSDGQKLRVAMGRAIVCGPKVFLIGEPPSNLDAKLRRQMRFELFRLHQRLGMTVIYVTNDPVEAMMLGTRVVVMNGGVLQQADTPQMLCDYPRNLFVAGFVGSPQMNFIDCKDFPFETKENVIVGIRPEKMVCGGEIKFNVDIEITELLGSEKIAYFNIGGKKCSAKLPADYNIENSLELSINPKDLYFFDAQTGKRIY